MSGQKIAPGAVLCVRHPFVRDVYRAPDPDVGDAPCWRPGTRGEAVAPDDSREVADADGAQIITVVDVHKPGKYPARVFYVRRWRDPDGKEFGSGALRIKTLQAFRRLARGYRFEYEVASK